MNQPEKDQLILLLSQKIEVLEQAMADPFDPESRKMSDRLGIEVRELQEKLHKLNEVEDNE